MGAQVAAAMAEESLSPELQQKIQTLQAVGGQLQQLTQQRQQFDAIMAESERARKALDKLADDAPVYRTVGSFMLGDSKEAALKRLNDDAETLQIRIKRAKDQEAQLEEQFNQLQSDVQKALGA